MKLTLQKICIVFYLFFLHTQVIYSQVSLQAIPTKGSTILAKDPLDVSFVLMALPETQVPAFNGIQFTITPSTEKFADSASLKIFQSALGKPEQLTSTPRLLNGDEENENGEEEENGNNGNNGNGEGEGNGDNGNGNGNEEDEEGPMPPANQNLRITSKKNGGGAVTVTVQRTDNANISAVGRIISGICIVTIDDLQIAFPDSESNCEDFTLYISEAALMTKEINGNVTLTPLPNDTLVVSFCPKCDIDDFSTGIQCSPDNVDFMADLSFTGNGLTVYTVMDNQGSLLQTGTGGTFTFGPYLNDTEVEFTVTDPSGTGVCNIPLQVDCNLYEAPSCTDGIQNQGEMAVDCGGPNCADCLACGLMATSTVVCEDTNQFSILIEVQDNSGTATYHLTDNQSSPLQTGQAGTYTFGPYNKGTSVRVKVRDSANFSCQQDILGKYQACTTCNFTPTNDMCSGATSLMIGLNGPYNNYCATYTNNEPRTASCLISPFSHSVWYSFIGTGGDILLTATDCGGFITDYEDDLQLAVYSDCSGTTEIACNDDFVGYQPQVMISTEAGQNYYVVLDGFGNYAAQGEYCLDIELCSPVCSITNSTNFIPCPNEVGGSITIDATNGLAPYTYKWNNGATTSSISNLPIGDYEVTVTGSNGCSCQANTVIERAFDPIESTLTDITEPDSTVITPFKHKKSTILTLGGTPPYSYQWTEAGFVHKSVLPLEGIAQISFSDNATWSVVITDENGCQVSHTNEPTLVIKDFSLQPTIENETNGEVQLTVAGGTPPYNYDWSTGDTGHNITNLGKGWYTVLVTDSQTPTPNQVKGWYWISVINPIDSGRPKHLPNNITVGAYPNPFINNTTISFEATKTEYVLLQIFTINRQKVATLFEGTVEKGKFYQIPFPAENLENGVYIYRLKTESGKILSDKLLLMK